MEIRTCANPACNRTSDRFRISAQGRCQACYQFLRRHGRDPTVDEMRHNHRVSHQLLCVNCGQAPARTQQRCQRCYRYRWRTGRDRPARKHQLLARLKTPGDPVDK